MGVVFIQQNNRHEKVFVGHRLCAYAVGDSAPDFVTIKLSIL